MVNRVFVILSLVAGLAVVAISLLLVRPHIQSIIDEREFNLGEWKKQEKRANGLQKDLRQTEEKLVATETELKDTQTRLAAETSRANTQEELAKKLDMDLTETRGKLSTAEQELAAWNALGLMVDQVKAVIASEKSLREITMVLEAEKVVLTRVNRDLDLKLKSLLGDSDQDQPLPAGTQGKVLVVDPKWKFVVLDLGEKNQVVKNGVLMVSRDGKLVAKVKITNVYSDRCIANVLPGWDFSEILEGDLVLY